MSAPLLDTRTFEELHAELVAEASPAWTPAVPGDAGSALVWIFAHYLEILLARLNRVPEKQLIAFLDLMGVGLLPPGAARTPLVFTLAPAAGEQGRVPRGTQVATAQTETDPAVIFETERPLVVVASRLVASYTVQPERDRYANRSAVVRGEQPLTYNPFVGDRRLDHTVWLGLDRPLLEQRTGRLFVDFGSVVTKAAARWIERMVWDEWRDGDWQPLPPARSFFRGHGLFRFENVPGPQETTAAGAEGAVGPRHWLRGRVTRPLVAQTPLDGFPFEYVKVGAETATVVDDAYIGSQFAGTPLQRVSPSDRIWLCGPQGNSGSLLLLRSDDAFGRSAPEITVFFDLVVPAALPTNWFGYGLRWVLWDQSVPSWRSAADRTAFKPYPVQIDFEDTTDGLTQSGYMTFRKEREAAPGKPDPALPAGAWIALAMLVTDSAGQQVKLATPPLGEVRVLRPIAPELGVLNTAPVDVSKPFLPFGELPRTNDAFYVGSREAFSQRGAEAHVLLDFGTAGVATPGASREDIAAGTDVYFRLTWEYPTATGWQTLGSYYRKFHRGTATTTGGPTIITLPTLDLVGAGTEGAIDDTTEGFARIGGVRFTVPNDIVETEVAGQRSFWVRVRIADGDFGRPPEFVPVSPTDPSQGLRKKFDTGNLHAPSLQSLRLAYFYTDTFIEPTLLARNGFELADLTEENHGTLSTPVFHRVEDETRTLYLGLDRKPPNTTLNLFFAVPARQVVEHLPEWTDVSAGEVFMIGDVTPELATTLAAPGASTGPVLAWEYWNGSEWTELDVVDGTTDLTETGLVQLIAPTDMTALSRFAEERWWIRVRLRRPDEYSTRLSGVYLNAVDGVQAHTVRDEVLGSSTGEKGQRFRFAQGSIAPGQRIVVREPERPPAADLDQLVQEEGADPVSAAAEGSSDVWVRWHEVPTLLGSDESSRHYTVDRVVGEIRFGDGVHGLVPPAGMDNVVAREYVVVGGDAGNRPASSVTKLKTSIPYIGAVTNPVPADGGSAAESVQEALVRGPQSLRHARHAVSADDFEWLAREVVGTRVARARALPERNRDLDPEPGWVTVVVVPRGAEAKPLPTAQLVRELEDALEQRAAAALAAAVPARINLIGPGYLPVELAVEFEPVSLDEADATREDVLGALRRLLHPLEGGPDGGGWPFGRDVYLSEVFTAIENLAGVEHVHSLRFKPTVATIPLRLDGPQQDDLPPGLPVAYRPGVGLDLGGLITTGDDVVVGKLVEAVPAGSLDAIVTVFQEGELLTLTPIDTVAGMFVEDEAVEVAVRGISGSNVEIEAFVPAVDFPARSTATTANGTGSTLTAPLAAGTVVDRLAVQGFEPAGASDPPLPLGRRLRVPDSHLVYSGVHTVSVRQD